MVLSSQIKKVVLRCVTGVTPNKKGHYIASSGKSARTLSCMRFWCRSFAKNTFLRISTGRGK